MPALRSSLCSGTQARGKPGSALVLFRLRCQTPERLLGSAPRGTALKVQRTRIHRAGPDLEPNCAACGCGRRSRRASTQVLDWEARYFGPCYLQIPVQFTGRHTLFRKIQPKQNTVGSTRLLRGGASSVQKTVRDSFTGTRSVSSAGQRMLRSTH